MTVFGKDPKSAKILRELNEIAISLSSQNNVDIILKIIIERALQVSNASKGILYLVTNDNKLEYALVATKHEIKKCNSKKNPTDFIKPIEIFKSDKQPNLTSLAVNVFITKESINLQNLYQKDNEFLSYDRNFDKKYNATEKVKSTLAIPLKNNKNNLVGVLHLFNAKSPRDRITNFSKDIQYIIESLASLAAVAIEKQHLIQEQKRLLDGIIKMIALAIDAKSSHTGKHCQAIPVIVEMMAKAANKQNEGYFKDFKLTPDEMYELKVASWLHDCGKLTTPLSILDKSTKLQMVYDGIEHIKTRAEILARDYEIDYIKEKITKKEYREKISQLKNDLRFLTALNKGSEYISDERIARLNEIAGYQYINKLKNSKDKLKQDFLNKEELYNLNIRKGTLNPKEREIINNHMQVTIDMLESLPLPKHLQRVPEYAGGHHEKMDGTGFPKGLKRQQMSIPARIMAIADIFEALTSHDRPYKKVNTLSETLAIMKKMQENNHIDPDIFELFVKEKIYLKYGQKFLSKKQLDMG